MLGSQNTDAMQNDHIDMVANSGRPTHRDARRRRAEPIAQASPPRRGSKRMERPWRVCLGPDDPGFNVAWIPSPG